MNESLYKLKLGQTYLTHVVETMRPVSSIAMVESDVFSCSCILQRLSYHGNAMQLMEPADVVSMLSFTWNVFLSF